MAALIVAPFAASCADSDDAPDHPATSSSVASTSRAFTRDAERVCADAEQQLSELGKHLSVATPGPDPVVDALIRPGTKILAQEAAQLRGLAARDAPSVAEQHYLDYFELIDAVLTARLAVGRPGGPPQAEANALERRFQNIATEQETAASAAGLSRCSFDVVATIFGS